MRIHCIKSSIKNGNLSGSHTAFDILSFLDIVMCCERISCGTFLCVGHMVLLDVLIVGRLVKGLIVMVRCMMVRFECASLILPI
jgi:uncharacterized membrane protein